MNNIALGQYVHKNSLIHNLDPRTKLISLLFLMIGVFLIPSPADFNPTISFIMLGSMALILLIIILLTKISLLKYLKSLTQVIFIIGFIFIIQMVTKPNDETSLLDLEMKISWFKIAIIVVTIILFIVFRKYLKAKLLILLAIIVLSVYFLTIDFGNPIFKDNPILHIYKYGLYKGAFFSLRILLVIMLSTILTLTTKPTDLTSAIEWFLHPLTYIKLNVSIFAMMISLALRFIPTLFNETNKILKAQSSRGADFKEGNLKEQLFQVVSLLIPMFVISYKRADDLADAMEARGYIPGAPRTKLNVLKFKFFDYLSLILILIIFASIIVLKVIL